MPLSEHEQRQLKAIEQMLTGTKRNPWRAAPLWLHATSVIVGLLGAVFATLAVISDDSYVSRTQFITWLVCEVLTFYLGSFFTLYTAYRTLKAESPLGRSVGLLGISIVFGSFAALVVLILYIK